MTSYQIQIIAPAAREASIQTKVNSTAIKREFYGFRNRRSELPVIQVPIGLPVYRMENFRTFTDQHDYISAESKADDFFSGGQESETVQQAQHLLLARLASKGKADSVVPVIDVLRKDGQREPLLITSFGVVVNGNRRLAAMRELYAEDGKSFAHFSHIDAMVLPPDATDEEIVDVEANLQAMPETKLDYDWIGELQLIKRLTSIGRTFDQIANQLHRKERDIQNALQALAEADLYLKEAGSAGSYSEIRDDAEQLFNDLPKALEGKSEKAKQASRAIAYTLFRNKELVPGRLYDFNPAFGKLADDVIDRMAGLGKNETPGFAEDKESPELFLNIPEDDGTSHYDAIIKLLRSDDDEVVEALIDAAQTAIELDKGKRSGSAALKSIGQAHAKLASADVDKASKETLPGINKQLLAIRELVGELEKTVAKRLKTSSSEIER
ncbi:MULTISPECIES: hypothetical protein [unclassified Rhizobium]|uniref:hypothetical protein n=1 Tax=unclassified Rhizobium TaxID=2613769 RepID=UPI001C834B7D|nr:MULTISPECIES: hypothetical protein [unclassified Rhizobium]MBX5248782.1 hypothetical protein [Rhizobium sp. NLR3b]MBX5309536.1 hypothetical protein [Rhizobium sp. NLR14b]